MQERERERDVEDADRWPEKMMWPVEKNEMSKCEVVEDSQKSKSRA